MHRFLSTPGLSVLAATMLLGAAPALFAQDSTNVLVMLNEASTASQQIAEHYADVRHIPPDNIVHVRTAILDEIDRGRYDAEIERPVAEWIMRRGAQDRILYIVLTKGIPLRIRGTGGLSGTVGSVDSELTLLYRKLLGSSAGPPGRIPNPYFQGDAPLTKTKRFSHATHDIYLVTRLDGFTVPDVFKLIDRAAAPARNGIIVLDQKGNTLGDRSGDTWLAAAAQRLTDAGFEDRVVLESSSAALTGRREVLGYYSWGSNDPALARRKFDLNFVPGALAAMFVSTDARTFKEPPDTWTIGKWSDARTYFEGSPQSLAGDLIREGVTGVAGHVAEPYLDGSIRPQILFPAYVAGFNLAESYYLAMPYLSWQTVVIGDPLCAPFQAEKLTSEEAAPTLDPDTELPRFFSGHRLAILASYGAKADIVKLLLKANARLLRGDIAGGQQALEAVIAIDPTLNGANLLLAGLYERAGEYDKAAERYSAILATRPDDVRALNNLAYLLAAHKGAAAEALPLADRAYKLAAGRELIEDLGFAVVARRGTPSSSLPFSEQAFSLSTSHAQIADTVGWAHHLLGHEAEADHFVSEALAGDPGNADIQLHVATVKEAVGQKDLAAAALGRALELDPRLANSNDVKRLRARLGMQ